MYRPCLIATLLKTLLRSKKLFLNFRAPKSKAFRRLLIGAKNPNPI